MFFALDSDHWSVKPGYFMQPWTLMSPGTMGQYPAAAMIYREGLVSPGDVLVNLNLKIADLENLHGTPMPQDASFDELRLKDVPKGTTLTAGSVIDPLVHYAGRTNVAFSDAGVRRNWSIWPGTSTVPRRPSRAPTAAQARLRPRSADDQRSPPKARAVI